MAVALTIFASKLSYERPLQRLRASCNSRLEVIGYEKEWQKLIVRDGSSTLTFSSLRRVAPGDQFSKLILGASTFFRRVETSAIKNKDHILKAISGSKMILGIVAEPKMMQEYGHFDLVFDIAEELEGIIFNGGGILNAQGLLILDGQGNSEMSVA
jgi:hypothetical protein